MTWLVPAGRCVPLAPIGMRNLCCSWLVRNSIPWTVVNDPLFKQLIREIASIGHAVRLGSDTHMKKKVLGDKVAQVRALIKPEFTSAPSYSMIVDGWKTRYMPIHLTGVIFSFMSPQWCLRTLFCLVDAGVSFPNPFACVLVCVHVLCLAQSLCLLAHGSRRLTTVRWSFINSNKLAL